MTLPAGERGATRIADRVVAKIAAQAAREALRGAGSGVRGAAVRGASASASGEDEVGPPYADVTVHDDIVRVRVAVELGYPSDIGAQCGAVRRRIAERVKALAGMDVPEVAVTVERLHSVHTGAAGRERVR
ncbi:Asp23/Gls24 family envelope stress response protein [Streptomyces sp. NRRL B-1677]|uniref:Asp23/Gls24 family envelope stress response protein n=1 Tax=Streptomyces klenkii TaxID=1420899 RepID=A0A3B0BP74_9ACTN|nr:MULTISPECIES: Asp23/Gls24 family envelope stress response protein [Streptomyces]MBF6046696.1 Asp23/Gls24 family envelope stress response protein [Streptomyces sp. NRRL B-1677]RKN75193.1 Asp23/Gls24 family envelope stress response protein [Streptomyces klenkii]